VGVNETKGARELGWSLATLLGDAENKVVKLTEVSRVRYLIHAIA
jgi:hypothetical protein